MYGKKSTFIGLLSVILIFCFSSLVVSQEQKEAEKVPVKVSPKLEEGIGLFKHENFDEALEAFKNARQEDPDSTLAAYYQGLTYKQLQDYKAAVAPLRDSVTKKPKIIGALIELIDCLYQIDQLDEADLWIGEAEKAAVRPAQIAFLKGLVRIKQSKNEEAIKSFENAKALDPTMTQAADYQIAIGYLKEGKYSNAKSVFQQLVLADPNSTMATFANQYMDAVTQREKALRPFKGEIAAYWQYDDNVVLKPDDNSVAAGIAGKADSREVLMGNAEYNFRPNDQIGLKAQYFLYSAWQNQLSFYDTLSNTFVLQTDFNFGSGLLSVPVAYNLTLVDQKTYLSSPSVSGVYSQMVNNTQMAQLFLKCAFKDFRWESPTRDEDRSGNDLGGGLGWYFFFMKNKGFLNFRYAGTQQNTEGSNWANFQNEVTSTLLVPVTDKFNVTVSGGFNAQSFDNRHTVFQETRQDRIWTLSGLAAFKVYKDNEIQLQYTFVKDSSNIAVYEYTRNIFSAGLDVKF